jgi:hypothetical protein
MRNEYTLAQIKMLVLPTELQLPQIARQALELDAAARNIAKASHLSSHEAVAGLIRLFRDHVPGAANTATLIAREYVKGADAKSNAPTLACVRNIEAIARQAREQYLPSDMESG